MTMYVYLIQKRRFFFWWRFDTIISSNPSRPVMPKKWRFVSKLAELETDQGGNIKKVSDKWAL